MNINLTFLQNKQIEALQGKIVSIYRNAFSAPPYNKPESEIKAFAKTLPTQFDRQDYRFLGAFDDSGQLTGFSYGYSTRAGKWWCLAVEPALPKEKITYWLDGSFQLVELVVEPDFQGLGIGGKLHDFLLKDLQYERVTLSTLQADTAAHHLYQKRGWVTLLENFFFPGVERRYQIMGLERKNLPGKNPAPPETKL